MTDREKQIKKWREEQRDFTRNLGFFLSGIFTTLMILGLYNKDYKSTFIVAILALICGVILWIQTPRGDE